MGEVGGELQALVRLRDGVRERSRGELAKALLEQSRALRRVESIQAAISAHRREATPRQEGRLDGAALRREGQFLRGRQAKLRQLELALSEATRARAKTDAVLRRSRQALARADAEYRSADLRREGAQTTAQRARRAAIEDELDELATSRHARDRA